MLSKMKDYWKPLRNLRHNLNKYEGKVWIRGRFEVKHLGATPML